MNRSLEELPHGASAEYQRVPLDVTLEHLPGEVREKATQDMLRLMRSVLGGLEKYVIFSSTAMYLQGERIGDPELTQAPGDLDVLVQDEPTLREIAGRLRNVPGVTFDHEGIARPFPAQDTQVLAGKVLMSVNDVIVSYPFEFFLNTRVLREDVYRHKEKIGGLNVLTLEGLKKQYLNNLTMESRMVRATEEAAQFLLDHAAQIEQGGPLRDVVLRTYGLNDDQLVRFYDLQRRLQTEQNEKERERLQSVISRLLSGVKTKVAQRARNVSALSARLKN